MLKLMKNSFKLKKKTRQVESDAAPSKPRPVEENIEVSSSSDDDFQDNFKQDNTDNNYPQDYSKDFENKKFSGSNSNRTKPFSQTNHIVINNGTNIHLGNNYNFNNIVQTPFQHSGKKTPAEEEPYKPELLTPQIEATFSNRETVTKEDFIAIKSDIGSNWRAVAEKLGLNKSDIDDVYNRYKSRDNDEVFYHLMLKWMQVQSSSTTTVGILCKALWYSNETAAATTLSKLYSTN